MQTISIHAPREWGDSSANRCRSCWIHFNPRPPRGGRQLSGRDRSEDGDFNPRPPRGGRLVPDISMKTCVLFQSTPPARGATMNLRRGSRYF